MPDWLPAGVGGVELAILLATVLVAGIVYGFAGFGAALIYMPVAARIVPIDLAIAAFAVSALASLVTVVPQAISDIDRRGTTIMIGTATVGAFVGLYVLKVTDLIWLRWAVVSVTTLTLLALISGWRYRTVPTDRSRGAIGLSTGFVGGATGLLGPVMVLFQLAGRDGAARNRATSLVFLTTTSVLLLPLMALQGILGIAAIPLGLVMLVPYGVGTWIGRRMFRPEAERLYRGAAYMLIAVAIVIGLPLFD